MSKPKYDPYLHMEFKAYVDVPELDFLTMKFKQVDVFSSWSKISPEFIEHLFKDTDIETKREKLKMLLEQFCHTVMGDIDSSPDKDIERDVKRIMLMFGLPKFGGKTK